MKKIKRYLLLGLLVICLYPKANAQSSTIRTENQLWFPGSVHLVDGAYLSGDLNYNFVTKILSFRNGDELPDAYSSKNVVYFVLKNEGSGKSRKYYSLPYAVKGRRSKGYLFFEVLYENEQIALLSHLIYDFRYATGTGSYGSHTEVKGSATGVKNVVEVLYLADNRGNMEKYAYRIKSIAAQLEPGDSLRPYVQESVAQYRMVRKNILYEMTNSSGETALRYAKEQAIKLNTIEGTSRFLDHFTSASMAAMSK